MLRVGHRIEAGAYPIVYCQMQHYPKMTTEFPAKSEEFRRVLWTGQSSQLVEMTIPVGGDIGEEVNLTSPV